MSEGRRGRVLALPPSGIDHAGSFPPPAAVAADSGDLVVGANSDDAAAILAPPAIAVALAPAGVLWGDVTDVE